MSLGELGSTDGGREERPSILVVLCGFHDAAVLGMRFPQRGQPLSGPCKIRHETRLNHTRAPALFLTYNFVELRIRSWNGLHTLSVYF